MKQSDATEQISFSMAKKSFNLSKIHIFDIVSFFKLGVSDFVDSNNL